MYDDDVGDGVEAGACVGAAQGRPGPPHHWYDEPPYESDPEDFLIGKDAYRWAEKDTEDVCVATRALRRIFLVKIGLLSLTGSP